eukprot:486857_1
MAKLHDERWLILTMFAGILCQIALVWILVPLPIVHTNQNTINANIIHFKITFTDQFGKKRSCNSWPDLIETIDGFELFMDFLKTHWNIQCLLFATEYIQLVNVMFQNDIFTQKFKNIGKLPVDQTLPFILPLSTINSKLEKQLNGLYFVADLECMLSDTDMAKLRKTHLKKLSEFVSRFRQKKEAFVINEKIQKESLDNILSSSYFIDAVSKYYLKYISLTGPLRIKVNKKLRRKIDCMFGNRHMKMYSSRVSTQTEICVDVLNCLQCVFQHVSLDLDMAFRRYILQEREKVLLQKKHLTLSP